MHNLHSSTANEQRSVESDCLLRLPEYPLAGVERAKEAFLQQSRDLIDLGQGDPDLPPPPCAIAALQQALQQTANHHYPPFAGTSQLRRAIADWYAKRFGVELDPEREVLVLLGAKEGLTHLPLAICNHGDVVLHPDPCYPAFPGGAVMANAQPYPIPSSADFLPELERVPSEIAARTRLIYQNFPTNPTGAVASLAYLEQSVDFARKVGAVLCHDAVYSELYFEGSPPHSILEIPGAKEVAVEVHSFSKIFCMTGWRVGMIVGNQSVIQALAKVKTIFDSGVFPALQEAAIIALQEGASHIETMRHIYHQRRDVMANGLNRLGWSVTPPTASFYLWAPLAQDVSSAQFVTQCLTQTGLLMTPGTSFGPGGEGFVRMALNVDIPTLEEALRRLERWKTQGDEQ